MKDTTTANVSKIIDPEILAALMNSGRGKKKERLQIRSDAKISDPTFNPFTTWEKMKDGTKWKDTELATVTGIDRQTIGKIRKGTYSTKSGSTQHTIEIIAEALDVDPGYLTGDQKSKRKRKRTPEENAKIQKEAAEMEQARQLRILSDFLKIYSLHLKFDNAALPQKFWLYDADGELIRNGDDIEQLYPLVDIIRGHLQSGSSIISLFFGDVWIDEF